MDFSRLKESWGGIIIVLIVLALFILLRKSKNDTSVSTGANTANATGGVKTLPTTDPVSTDTISTTK